MLRVGPDAQPTLPADPTRADPWSQRHAAGLAGRRRAVPQARRKPWATQPYVRHSPTDTPHRRQPLRRGATRLPCPHPSLHQHCTRLPRPHPSPRQHCTRPPSPHPNRRPTPDRWSLMMTTGHPTTFRRLPLRRPHPTLEQTDQGARRPHPKTRHPLMPPLRSDARGIRSRSLRTLPTFPNPTYTDGSRSANRGRQRRHELQLSTLNTNRQVHLCADRRHRRHPAAGRELGSPCERGRFCPNEARFYVL